MNRQIWILGAVLVLATLAMSCGGDDEGGGGLVKPPTRVVLDVEPGTWRIVGKLTPATSGCLKFADIIQTHIYCDGIDAAQQAGGLGLECTFTRDGDQVQGSCGGTLSSGVTYSGSVSGGVGSNGRTVDVGGVMDVIIGEGAGATECRYAVTIIGTWTGPEGCGSASP